jgi:predicted anti-sigma-YlaC factor YlaD
MASCNDVQSWLGEYLDGGLDDTAALDIREHLADCADCRELQETLESIVTAIEPIRGIEPPPYLEAEIAASPCRRWLGLLHQAVDRDISQPNLERLLSHLESCETCRSAWADLTLIHQVGEALVAPQHVLDRCISVRRRIFSRPVLSRRAATAAAYVLAVLASLMIGNPVSIARSPTVQRVTETVTTEVNHAAEQGRSELKVMLWRAWQWTEKQADAARGLFQTDDSDPDSKAEQGAKQ